MISCTFDVGLPLKILPRSRREVTKSQSELSGTLGFEHSSRKRKHGKNVKVMILDFEQT